MASSMLTGDRRRAPTRKLTVLGKVPKPINLPSQRSENHGLDPNVEIVPKGTPSWGSKPSLAAPNAWGTSSISSPHTDGSAGSPSHRPSSGGSGTRPSTAGSDRSSEPVSYAWAANSRPSSASGILASSQISAAAARPRSAETRPGSSQLSRFADNSVDSTVVWGAGGTAERLGTTSSKSSGFTLSSGDFPSLGFDKNSDTHSQQGHSSQGRPHSSQGRPASASGTDSKPKGFVDPQLAGNKNIDHLDHGTVNTWKADNPPYAGHAASPKIENWLRDPHLAPPLSHMNMPPPHYDSWHNPPFRTADGAWYRGGGPPGPPPGSYSIDYPHGPARPLSNPQFPRPDAGPGGFYPNNCEPYCPYMPPEQYMGPGHPDVPVRPGAYPGPVSYEGYYGPPRPNFYSSSDREASIMGMAQPVVHNRFSSQHQTYNSANFHTRPGGFATVVNKEQIKHDQTHETQSGPYRVLLKQHDGSENCDELEKREHPVTAGSTHLEKGNHPTVSSQKGDWGTKSQTQETAVSPSLPGSTVSSQSTSGVDVQFTDTVRNSVTDSSKAADNGLVGRLEVANIQSRDPQQYTVIKKNATLLEKVEGLNYKARIADSYREVGAISSKEKRTFLKDVNARADRVTKVACATANSADNAASTLNMETAIPKDLNALVDDKNQGISSDGKFCSVPLNPAAGGENAYFLGQKIVHVARSVDHQAKLRSNKHDNNELMKKSPGSESSTNNTMISVKGRALESDASEEAREKQELRHATNVRDGSQTVSSLDPVDQKAQRAKTREIAIQRAKQRQQEEEERTREQKAKAFAKLEELNRRTLAESSNQKSDHAPQQKIDVLNSKQESGPVAMTTADTSVEASSANSACHSERVKQVDDIGIKKLGDSTDLSSIVAAQASNSSIQSSMVPQAQSLSIRQEIDATSNITMGTTSDSQHDTITRQKQVGCRKKHSSQQENIMGGKQVSSSGTRSPKDTGETAVNASRNDTLPNNEVPPAQLKKKNNKSATNNNTNKLDEGLTSSTLQSLPHTEGSSEKLYTESGKTKPSTLMGDTMSVPSESSNETSGTPDMPVNQGSSEIIDEAHGRVSNQWKPHPQRKTTRNQQPNKPVSKYHVTEAVMWAPVKPPSKNETSDEVDHNSMTEPTKPSGKIENDLQNGLKAKRAEIERYVPKPAAKELSQQANSQQTPPAVGQAASVDMTTKSETVLPSVASGRLDGPTVGRAAPSSDTRNGENLKHSKNGRTNASWRQRSSVESPPVEGSLPSDQAKTVQKASDELQASNIGNLPKGQLTHTDDGWNDDTGSVLPNESVTSTAVGKSYVASRQRRQSYKVHRVSGSNYPASDNIDSQQGTSEKSEHQSPASGHNESGERNVVRTESQNAGVESVKPHWQPKSQAFSHGWQGNRGSRQSVASQGLVNVPTTQEDINTSSQKTTVPDARDVRRQESRRERKVTADPSKEQTIAELAPAGAAYPREQAVPLEASHHGQHNARFQRMYDPNYRGRDWGQDITKQNFHMNGDKRKKYPHTEYQQIGSYDKLVDTFQQNSNAGEGTHNASRAPACRYRERGRHFQQGGGQLYGPSTGAAARANDSYNSGE